MKFPRVNVGIRIPVTYLLFGGLWILLSDRVLAFFVNEPHQLTEIQSIKGWAFVAASAIFIFVLLRGYLTYQKQVETKLRESEERLRLALVAAKQGIYDLNIQTGQTVVNDIYAEMLGYDPKTFVESNSAWLERMHPDDREESQKIFLAYTRGEIPEYRIEFRQKTLSGDWIWILSLGSIVAKDTLGHPLRIVGTHTNITSSKNAEIEILRLLEESNRRLQRIEILREIDLAISADQEFETTLKTLVTHVKNQLDVDAVAVLLTDEDPRIFSYAASLGFRTKLVENSKVTLGDSLAGKAAKQNTLVHISKVTEATLDPAFAAFLVEEGFQNYFGYPLKAKGKLKGVLELYHRSTLSPDEEWLSFYKTLAGQTAIAIENARLIEGLNKANEDLLEANSDLLEAYDTTIESLSKAIDMRDKETEGHSRRVTDLAINFARKMNFSEEEIVHIRRGALLHDIGKLGVSDAILNKPDILTDEERKIIQEHPSFAYKMLQSIPYLQPAIDIPYLHHEQWNGKGYPLGLSRENIPKAARMFAVIDVFEALTSNRAYRRAWTWQEAIKYIQDNSGTHFDPEVVSNFLEFVAENPTAIQALNMERLD